MKHHKVESVQVIYGRKINNISVIVNNKWRDYLYMTS